VRGALSAPATLVRHDLVKQLFAEIAEADDRGVRALPRSVANANEDRAQACGGRDAVFVKNGQAQGAAL
jgi:hypothetical protein